MKNCITSIIILFWLASVGYSNDTIKSMPSIMDNWKKRMLHNLTIAKHDTSRVLLYAQLSNYYKFNKPDSALYYGKKSLTLAKEINFPKGEASAMINIALTQITLGNESSALQLCLHGIKFAEKNNLIFYKAIFVNHLGFINRDSKKYRQALKMYEESMDLFESVQDSTFSTLQLTNIGESYFFMNQLDSALLYCQLAYDNSLKIKNADWLSTIALLNLGKIKQKENKYDLALSFYKQSLQLSPEQHFVFLSNYQIAKTYQQIDQPDSSIHYASIALDIAQESGIYSDIIDASVLLSGFYRSTNPQKALQFSEAAIAYKDSLDYLRKATASEAFTDFDEQEREYEIESAKKAYQNQVQRLWIFSISGALISAMILAFILFRNNKNKQKANALLREQKEEVQSTLETLEATQTQLIQSEKMASLGELTAGIAHEIQNPLNFVNNFSEVSKELAEELKEESKKTDLDKELIAEIATDISDNQTKILHHGQRASNIVKGMLEHSRTSDGKKEPTDINALADEYLRLAYHGLRAKDKSFNADFKTDLDKNLPKADVIPQEIGRVLLNLINNAFYAVDKKAKEGVDDYNPEVTVSTKKLDDQIEISVKDNGEGIPEKVRDKIFQPFFTTKPTGSGTGLGLSLSYDIVKAHGGEIKLESKEGQGTEFIIQIPLNSES